MAEEIKDAAARCQSTLTECAQTPSLMDYEWAENRLSEFKLWAAMTGAFASERASLDSRLSTERETKDLVINLLHILACSLEKCFFREVGGESPVAEPNGDKKSDDGFLLQEPAEAIPRSFSPWSDETSSDSEDEGISEAREERRAHPSSSSSPREEVEQIIDHLTRLAIAIRKSGSSARFYKADRLFIQDHHDQLRTHLEIIVLARGSRNGRADYDIDVRSLTPVQERLIIANLRRRNRYMYAQRHAKKLAAGASKYDPRPHLPHDSPEGLHVAGRSRSKSTPEQLLPNMQQATDFLDESQQNGPVMTATSASAVGQAIEHVPEHNVTPSQVAKTNITATTAKIVYPRPPREKDGLRYFKCPCCAQVLPDMFRQSSLWKKHLMADICPYTCIIEDCPKPYQIYVTRAEWNKHVDKEHQQCWQCPLCSVPGRAPFLFPSMEGFIDHLRQAHNNTISEGQHSTLVQDAARPIPSGISSCPLCDSEGPEDSSPLLDHIAEHVHAFSLRSLPWARDEVPEGGQGESDDGSDYNYFDEEDYFDQSAKDESKQDNVFSDSDQDTDGMASLPGQSHQEANDSDQETSNGEKAMPWHYSERGEISSGEEAMLRKDYEWEQEMIENLGHQTKIPLDEADDPDRATITTSDQDAPSEPELQDSKKLGLFDLHTLSGLFENIMDTIKKIETYKSFADGSTEVQGDLETCSSMLEQWGLVHGLNKSDSSGTETNEATFYKVKLILSTVDDYFKKILHVIHGERARAMTSESRISHPKKASGDDKRAAEESVHTVANHLDLLFHLVPSESSRDKGRTSRDDMVPLDDAEEDWETQRRKLERRFTRVPSPRRGLSPRLLVTLKIPWRLRRGMRNILRLPEDGSISGSNFTDDGLSQPHSVDPMLTNDWVASVERKVVEASTPREEAERTRIKGDGKTTLEQEKRWTEGIAVSQKSEDKPQIEDGISNPDHGSNPPEESVAASSSGYEASEEDIQPPVTEERPQQNDSISDSDQSTNQPESRGSMGPIRRSPYGETIADRPPLIPTPPPAGGYKEEYGKNRKTGEESQPVAVEATQGLDAATDTDQSTERTDPSSFLPSQDLEAGLGSASHQEEEEEHRRPKLTEEALASLAGKNERPSARSKMRFKEHTREEEESINSDEGEDHRVRTGGEEDDLYRANEVTMDRIMAAKRREDEALLKKDAAEKRIRDAEIEYRNEEREARARIDAAKKLEADAREKLAEARTEVTIMRAECDSAPMKEELEADLLKTIMAEEAARAEVKKASVKRQEEEQDWEAAQQEWRQSMATTANAVNMNEKIRQLAQKDRIQAKEDHLKTSEALKSHVERDFRTGEATMIQSDGTKDSVKPPPEPRRRPLESAESVHKAGKPPGPVKFRDAVGRKFHFPFHLCRTWEGMEELIKQAFLNVDKLGPHVQQGHYDLLGPDGEIILPAVWNKVIEPDWSITMQMWPMDPPNYYEANPNYRKGRRD